MIMALGDPPASSRQPEGTALSGLWISPGPDYTPRAGVEGGVGAFTLDGDLRVIGRSASTATRTAQGRGAFARSIRLLRL